MLYIAPIAGWDQSLHRRPVAVAVVVLLAIVVPLAGCGGSGEQTTGSGTTTAAGGSREPEAEKTNTTASVPKKTKKSGSGTPAEDSNSHQDSSHNDAGGHHRSRSSSGGPKQAESTAPATHQKSSGKDQPTRPSHQGASATGIEGASPVVVKKLRQRCPKRMEAAACDELVKTYLEAQNPLPAPPQPEPGQCPESLSQAECEAAIAAVKANEKGSSVSLEECLANMTPRCEETLRPVFEALKQAEEQAGE